MLYKKVTDSPVVTEYLAGVIAGHLKQGERVFWVIPGGSAMTVAVEVAQRLKGLETSNLHITLTDERFGDVGHSDSNWKQLDDAGFVVQGAHLTPVLTGEDIEKTTKRFAKVLEAELAESDFSIGLFGMGADGHTAGILPDSAAVMSNDVATHYQASNFSRITMTPAAISKLDEAVLYAFGPEKLEALEKLQINIALNEQPAQILKKVPKLIIYNNLIGDEI